MTGASRASVCERGGIREREAWREREREKDLIRNNFRERGGEGGRSWGARSWVHAHAGQKDARLATCSLVVLPDRALCLPPFCHLL